MKIALIVNSGAGRGRAGRSAESLATALAAYGSAVECRHTVASGDGYHLAADAAASSDVVVAVGGDGTVNEVARGLYESSSAAQMAVAPFGSGNDFAKVLHMPTRPDDVAAAIVSGRSYRVDLGRVKTRGATGDEEVLFINAVGIGFDALVASRTRASRKVRGVVGYLYLALRTLAEWDYPDLVVEADGIEVGTGPSLLVTVGNGTCSGGGFFLTPDAEAVDGRLDLCLIGRPTPLEIPGLAVRLLRGRHLGHPTVTYRQLRTASVHSEVPLFVHVDGEIVTNQARSIAVEVIPDALTVRSPSRRRGYGAASAALS